MSADVDVAPGGERTDFNRIVHDRSDAVTRARSLAPTIASRQEQVDQLRRIPDETIAELHESGLFSILTPSRFGGSELGPDAMFAAAVELGRADGSTGWTYGVLAGHTSIVAGFPEATQEEVFADPDVVVASLLRLNTEPLRRVNGGYELARAGGRFCSGVDHATWLIGRCEVEGRPGLNWVLIPSSEYEIIDDWFTMGLQGTGSKSLRVERTIIPDARVIPVADVRVPGVPGWTLPFSLCGAAIGCAYAAVDAYRDSLSAKGPSGAGQASLIRLAKASADVDASYLLVREAATAHLREDEASPLAQHAVGRNVSYAVQQARAAVNELFAASGGSAIYSSSPMQRIWRDVNAASAHVAFVWDQAGTGFGERFALGSEG